MLEIQQLAQQYGYTFDPKFYLIVKDIIVEMQQVEKGVLSEYVEQRLSEIDEYKVLPRKLQDALKSNVIQWWQYMPPEHDRPPVDQITSIKKAKERYKKTGIVDVAVPDGDGETVVGYPARELRATDEPHISLAVEALGKGLLQAAENKVLRQEVEVFWAREDQQREQSRIRMERKRKKDPEAYNAYQREAYHKRQSKQQKSE